MRKDQLPALANAAANTEFVVIGGNIHQLKQIHGYGATYVQISDEQFAALQKLSWKIGAVYKGNTTGKLYHLVRVTGQKEGRKVALVPLFDVDKMSRIGAHDVKWPTAATNRGKAKPITAAGTEVTSALLEANAKDFTFYADDLKAAIIKAQEDGSLDLEDTDQAADADF